MEVGSVSWVFAMFWVSWHNFISTRARCQMCVRSAEQHSSHSWCFSFFSFGVWLCLLDWSGEGSVNKFVLQSSIFAAVSSSLSWIACFSPQNFHDALSERVCTGWNWILSIQTDSFSCCIVRVSAYTHNSWAWVYTPTFGIASDCRMSYHEQMAISTFFIHYWISRKSPSEQTMERAPTDSAWTNCSNNMRGFPPPFHLRPAATLFTFKWRIKQRVTGNIFVDADDDERWRVVRAKCCVQLHEENEEGKALHFALCDASCERTVLVEIFIINFISPSTRVHFSRVHSIQNAHRMLPHKLLHVIAQEWALSGFTCWVQSIFLLTKPVRKLNSLPWR